VYVSFVVSFLRHFVTLASQSILLGPGLTVASSLHKPKVHIFHLCKKNQLEAQFFFM